MSIETKCSACGKAYVVKDEFAGKTAKCMQCGGRIEIPAHGRESPAHAELERSPVPVAPPQTGPIGPPPVAATPPPMPNQPPQLANVPQNVFLAKAAGLFRDGLDDLAVFMAHIWDPFLRALSFSDS